MFRFDRGGLSTSSGAATRAEDLFPPHFWVSRGGHVSLEE